MKALVWFGAPLLALTVIGAASYLVVCDTSKADVDAAQVSLVSAEATGDGCCAAPEATSVALKTEAACPVTGATKVAHAAADAAATCPHGPSTKATPRSRPTS